MTDLRSEEAERSKESEREEPGFHYFNIEGTNKELQML